ncbi:type II toxin-antitoxin system RelE/ParE family toxin [Caulobacter sp.]|uniref:type II toxin-antitoxin system RelE/ParE family toxin n=1 Tax=Caulobacter sp. TaxID=78 RepID=UPI002B46B413|nr:type II toxin-antitoxin system RelE/ParE family toxin [Caulobacter sp.]HJV42018.1 type II toxin-antitoxin system RelE/ParE family toxin [Caulobacter sp.]
MRRIIWTAEAVANLRSIFGYVSAFNAPAAERLARRLQTAADSLGEHPDRGRRAARGLRELAVIHPYLIRYRIRDDAVIVLRIRHGARDED